MRRLLPLLFLTALPILLSAAAPDPVTQARAEAAASEAEATRLEAAAANVGDEIQKLRASRVAAAAAVTAAEAQLAAAAINQSVLQSAASASAARLTEAQRPAASLLAGLVQLGRRPPLLALADQGSLSDFVRTRALLDAALPVIRARSAALAGQVAATRRLADAAAAAAPELARRRQALVASQSRFAALEREADAKLAALGGAALDAGDQALSRGERAEALAASAELARSAVRRASTLAAMPEAPARPNGFAPTPPPLAWRLPAAAPVKVGLAEISANGVRSRGLQLASWRGAPVVAPAAGRIAFAGPFRRHEGVVIIDHGDGWLTLLTEVRTALKVGSAVQAGDPIGLALGPIEIELTHRGTPQPAALIAGSSGPLSKGRTAG